MKANYSKKIPFFSHCVATGFFSGYFPFASGTFGSFIALLFLFIPFDTTEIFFFLTITLVFFVGVFTSGIVAKYVGDADPSIVVIDEFVGMWITIAFLPKKIILVVLAFFLFRIFDIWKPFPARQLENLRDGWGIMLDDVAAGMYANIILRVCLFFFPSLAL
ncbi:MAG: phosphatidylglycerophosphatase A [Bacteroidota bacterium]